VTTLNLSNPIPTIPVPIKEADKAERQTIEEVRNLGNDILKDWARQRVVRANNLWDDYWDVKAT